MTEEEEQEYKAYLEEEYGDMLPDPGRIWTQEDVEKAFIAGFHAGSLGGQATHD